MEGETVIACVVAPPGLHSHEVAVPPFSVRVSGFPLQTVVAEVLIPAKGVVTVNNAPVLVIGEPQVELTTTSYVPAFAATAAGML